MSNKIFLILFFAMLFGCKSSPEIIFEKKYERLDGTNIQLGNYKKQPYTLFIAFSNDCPVCKASIPIIREISAKYPDLGVVLFYPANQRDKKINEFIASLLPENVLTVKDKNKFLTNTLDAMVTPHAFIVDSNGKKVYNGAINNSIFTNYRKNYTKQEAYLIKALDTLLIQNKPLKRHETKVVGCYIE